MLSQVCLVIPCFNEAKRLQQGWTQVSQSPCPLLFVNDGSSDATKEWLESHVELPHQILHLERNCGKAEAVRQGMLHLMERMNDQSLEWVGYWDADFSAPLSQVQRFLDYREALAPEAKALFGSRIYCLGSNIYRTGFRHWTGRLFATLLGVLFPDLHVYDSQCGAKLFHRSVISIVFSRPFLSRWLFDVEILLRLADQPVVEVPLARWTETPGSRLPLWKAPAIVLRDLWRIRTRRKDSVGPTVNVP